MAKNFWQIQTQKKFMILIMNKQIDEIIAANHDVYYDTLAQANADGYDNGHWCIGGSTR